MVTIKVTNLFDYHSERVTCYGKLECFSCVLVSVCLFVYLMRIVQHRPQYKWYTMRWNVNTKRRIQFENLSTFSMPLKLNTCTTYPPPRPLLFKTKIKNKTITMLVKIYSLWNCFQCVLIEFIHFGPSYRVKINLTWQKITSSSFVHGERGQCVATFI